MSQQSQYSHLTEPLGHTIEHLQTCTFGRYVPRKTVNGGQKPKLDMPKPRIKTAPQGFNGNAWLNNEAFGTPA